MYCYAYRYDMLSSLFDAQYKYCSTTGRVLPGNTRWLITLSQCQPKRDANELGLGEAIEITLDELNEVHSHHSPSDRWS